MSSDNSKSTKVNSRIKNIVLVLLPVLILSFCSRRADAAINFVQANSSACLTAPGTSVTCSYPSTVTVGDLLVATVMLNNVSGSAYTVSVSDPINGAWTPLVGCFSPYTIQAAMFYVPSSAAGSITVTATSSTSVSRIASGIVEYSGTAASSVLDGTASCALNSGGTTVTAPSITTSNANDLILNAAAIDGTSGTITVTAPYTKRGSANNSFADQVVSSTGTYTGTKFTYQYSDNTYGMTSAFKAAGALPVATPTASPAAGTYGSAQSVTLSDATPGATICFTTDGTTPAASTPGTCSHGSTYSAPIVIATSTTLKAIGTKTSFSNSAVLTAAYTISIPTVATPTASPAAGTYSSTQTVSLLDSTGGATICYTVDGSTPAATTPGTCSHGSTYSAPITVSATETIKAIGTEASFVNSGVLTAAYIISIPPVATPTASPAAGTYGSTQSVSLMDSTVGATICYTIDGTTPAASTPGTCSHGSTYSSPITVSLTTTIEAIGTEAGFTNSALLTAAYTISGGTNTATVIICPNNGQTGNNANCAPSPQLIFGKQGTGTASMAIPISVNNCSTPNISGCTGTGSLTLGATPFAISGTNAADFAVANGTCSAGGGIVSGSFCSPTVTFTPSSPSGTTESATLTVSDNGTTSTQTLSLSGISATVTSLSACGTLAANTNYQLTSNLTASQACLIDNAANIDVNLNGHTITYCNTSSTSLVGAVLANGFSESNLTLHNGTITEGAGLCTGLTTILSPSGYGYGSGVFVVSSEGNQSQSSGTTMFNLNVPAINDARGKLIFEEDASAAANGTTIHDVTYVDNDEYVCSSVGCRAGGQGYPIQIKDADSAGATNIYNLTGRGGTQGTLSTSAPNSTLEYNFITSGNTVSTNTNGFIILAYGPNTTISNNLTTDTGSGGSCLSCRGQEISSAAGAAVTGTVSKNNVLYVTQLANDSEYSGCQLSGAYGIQLNTAGSGVDLSNNTIQDNNITVVANQCEAKAFAFSNATNAAGPNKTIGNHWECDLASGSTANPCSGAFFDAHEYSPAPDGSLVSTNDTFLGDTSALYVMYDGTSDWTCKQCAFGTGKNPVAGWLLLDYDGGSVSGAGSSPFTLIDPMFTGGATKSANNLSIWASHNSGLSFYYLIQWTYTVLVETTSSSTPISGASVSIVDTNSTTECSTTTNGSGIATCTLNDTKYSAAGGAYTTPSYNPMSITISSPGCTTLNYGETVTSTTGETKKLSGC